MPEIFDATQVKKTRHTPKTRKENIVEAERYSSLLRVPTTGSATLAAFSAKPPHVAFDVQHAEEPVLLLLRQHPITNLKWVLTALFLGIFPLIFLYVPLLSWLPSSFQTIIVLGWYLFVVGFIFENFLLWFFNIYMITDERVIDVDFYSLVFKKISEAKIENIEDISASHSGFLQSILDFGHVQIQTAAEIPQIDFENVPRPNQVSKFLSEMLDQEEQERLEGRVR